MTPTIFVLITGLGISLVGVGLMGTLLGVRASLESFSSLQIGFIMAGYYLGYIGGTHFAPGVIRNVGHIRCFAALAAITTASALAFGLFVSPWVWLLLRIINGASVVGLYMVVESWLNEQSNGPSRGRIFSTYMMSTLGALGAGQLLLLGGDPSQLMLFAMGAIFISLGVVPIAMTRVSEPKVLISEPIGVKALLKISPLGTVGVLASGVVTGSFWGMLPVFGAQTNLSESQIASLMGLIIIGGATLQWPIGHISDLMDRRKALIGTTFTTAAILLFIIFNLEASQWLLLPAIVVFGGLMFSLYGLSVAHTNDHIGMDQVLEATRGLLLIYGIGAMFGPLASGFAMDLFGPLGLLHTALLSLLLLTLYGGYRLTRREAPPVEEQSDFVPMVRTSPLALDMMPSADPEQEVDLEHVEDPPPDAK